MLIENHIPKVRFYGALVALAAFCLSLVPLAQSKSYAANRPVAPTASPVKPKGLVRSDYGKRSLLFEANRGQIDPAAQFLARGHGYSLFLASAEAVFSLNVAAKKDAATGRQTDVLRMGFAGANPRAKVTGDTQAITKTNYYTGRKQVENVPNFRRVNYRGLYPGIDAVFYGDENNQSEYDFVIAPNADPNQIELSLTGAESVRIDADGNLVIQTPHAELIQHRPVAYQETAGVRREVASRFVLDASNSVKFEVGAYDRSHSLVIDPKISYSTYLGGTSFDVVQSIKADAVGNVYVTGATESANFPSVNPRTSDGSFAVYVAKIAPDGQSLLYTTFLDGSGNDGLDDFFYGNLGNDIAIDAFGNAYVAGITLSADFPVSANAYQTHRYCNRQLGFCANPQEAFVTKLNQAGAIVYSTFLGGGSQDFANGIVVDSAGKAYVTGATYSGITFPTKNEYQGTGFFGATIEAFLTVFNADGSDITYSTGLGGNHTTYANDIAIDPSNNVYLGGETDATNFPVRNAFQSTNRGGIEAFVAKFNPALSGNSSLIYSTLIGGAGTDRVLGIAVNDAGSAHITGLTGSFNFPLQVPIRSVNQINEAFVSALDATGSQLTGSTYLGGGAQESGNDIEVDDFGNIYVTGFTSSTDFPTAVPSQATLAGGSDAFLTKLKFAIGIKASTYLGGSNTDSGASLALQNGRVAFVAGLSLSSNLPTTAGVLQPTNTNGDPDGFITRFLDTHVDSVGVFRPASSSFLLTQSTTTVVSQTAPSTGQLAGQKGVSGDWDGDGTDTIGSFTNGTWKIRNANFPTIVLPPPLGAITVTFGTTGDLPVAGDWNGDGIDTPGIYRPSTAQFVVTDSTDLSPSFNLRVTRVNFGLAGDLPISGDWDGDGKDSVALFRPSTGQTFFTNADVSVKSVSPITLNPGVDQTAFLGVAEDLPMGGDWNGDGIDSLGLWRPSTAQFFLSDDNGTLRPTFIFGLSTDQPIMGDWDGKP